MTEGNKKTVGIGDMLPIIKEQLSGGGSVCFSPKGTSMLPLIRQGEDSVVISPIYGRAKKCDVVLYTRADGLYSLHRVMKVRKTDYVMCGDNQTDLEYGITDESIIGIMTEIKKPSGTVKVTDRGYRRYSARRVRSRFFRRVKVWLRVKFSK